MIDPISINFTNYKRIFTFGCSFTAWHWPTWADIISYECPHAEFFNLGFSSAGNMYISQKINESHIKFKFNKDDLIIIMWSTFFREDRYYKNSWHFTGPIDMERHQYGKEWQDRSDPKGYLIRDLNLIGLVKGFLENLKLDFYFMLSVPFTEFEECKSFHKDTHDIFLGKDLFTLEMKGVWEMTHPISWADQAPGALPYKWPHSLLEPDYHPITSRYRSYLEKLHFPLTTLSLDKSVQSDLDIKRIVRIRDMSKFRGYPDHDFSMGGINPKVGDGRKWY